MTYRFTTEIVCATREQAEQVMAERCAHDEDYGFSYTLAYRAADEPRSIHDLMDAVRAHPAFVFGTIFTTADFGGRRRTDFDERRATDVLIERGSEFIGAAPCIERRFDGGGEIDGAAEIVSFEDFAQNVVQDFSEAVEIASAMLEGEQPYAYNTAQPQFRETFTITDPDELRDQLAALDG